MKVLLCDDVKSIGYIKRLVMLKANLGVSEWAGDFKKCDFDINELIDYIDDELERLSTSFKLFSEMSYEEDDKYFNTINKSYDIQKIFETGVIDVEKKTLIKKYRSDCPQVIIELLDYIDDGHFVWIV